MKKVLFILSIPLILIVINLIPKTITVLKLIAPLFAKSFMITFVIGISILLPLSLNLKKKRK